MKSKKEIIKSAAYWLAHLQIELYQQLKSYMESNNLNQNDMAKKLKVSKGHISQILNGDSNFTLKKLITLSLAIKKVPVIKFVSLSKYLSVELDIQHFFDNIEYKSSKVILRLTVSNPSTEIENPLQEILTERKKVNVADLIHQFSQSVASSQNNYETNTIH